MPDTIVAIATPIGRSGIGVVRLSGDSSLSILRQLIGNDSFSSEPRTAHLKRVFDPETRETLDEALITFFKAPHSFTGEDVVEISCHGSPIVLREIIDVCLQLGARLAEAGEFSLRALANGRMDLTEAEAIRDLIDAQTVAYARQAVRQLGGEFSHELQPIKDELLDVIVVLESAIEFVEDDLPAVQSENISNMLRAVQDSIKKIGATYAAGRLLREGLRVAIVGRPNVGKSSLFNALLGSERAIVTDIAGTTRDQLHEKLTIHDIPISLIDTAGLRDTMDTVESIGVERSRRTMADSDVVVVMLDVSEALNGEDLAILNDVSALNHLVAFNKIDKVNAKQLAAEMTRVLPKPPTDSPTVAISARTGAGLDDLRDLIVKPFRLDETSDTGFLISDARHHDLLTRAEAEITQSLDLLNRRASEEIVLIGLHNALRFLGQITGETTTEDMLTRIFATFCIGK